MKNRKTIIYICIVIMILIIAYLSYSIYKDIYGGNSKDVTVSDVVDLQKDYREAKAWIKIEGTSVNAPIFQGMNNDKYLRNNRNGELTEWGELFLDYRNDLNQMEDKANIIVYGHNTEQDSYFSSLLKYEEKSFFDKNKIIKFSTSEKTYEFEIFSVLKTNIDYYYIDTNFESLQEYNLFVEDLKGKSIYDTGVIVESNDTILTLSTCDYTTENGRFVVIGRLKK